MDMDDEHQRLLNSELQLSQMFDFFSPSPHFYVVSSSLDMLEVDSHGLKAIWYIDKMASLQFTTDIHLALRERYYYG